MEAREGASPPLLLDIIVVVVWFASLFVVVCCLCCQGRACSLEWKMNAARNFRETNRVCL